LRNKTHAALLVVRQCKQNIGKGFTHKCKPAFSKWIRDRSAIKD
jgi:hypothetical protein